MGGPEQPARGAYLSDLPQDPTCQLEVAGEAVDLSEAKQGRTNVPDRKKDRRRGAGTDDRQRAGQHVFAPVIQVGMEKERKDPF